MLDCAPRRATVAGLALAWTSALLPGNAFAHGPGETDETATQKWVLVHIDSPEVVKLQSLTTPKEEWADVCDSPCDRPVALDAEYRIGGVKSVSMSKTFHLQAPWGATDRVVLRVEPRHQSGVSAGTALALGGGLMALGGLAAFFFNAAGNVFCSDNPNPQSTLQDKPCDNTGAIFGGIVAGAGVVALFAGIAIAASNASSHVSGDVRPEALPPETWALHGGPRGLVVSF